MQIAIPYKNRFLISDQGHFSSILYHVPKENATFCKKKPLERGSFFNQDDMLNIQPQKKFGMASSFSSYSKGCEQEKREESCRRSYRLLSNE